MVKSIQHLKATTFLTICLILQLSFLTNSLYFRDHVNTKLKYSKRIPCFLLMSSTNRNEIHAGKGVTTTTSTTTRSTATSSSGRLSFSSSKVSVSSFSVKTSFQKRGDELQMASPARLGKSEVSFFPNQSRSGSRLYSSENNPAETGNIDNPSTMADKMEQDMETQTKNDENSNSSVGTQEGITEEENQVQDRVNTVQNPENTINGETINNENGSETNSSEEMDETEEKDTKKKSMWNRVSSIFNQNGGETDDKNEEEIQRNELNAKIEELEKLSRALDNSIEIAEKKLKSTGKEGFYRAAAEIDTYKKRRQDTLDRLKHTAEQETILTSLPVIDMFHDAQGKFSDFQGEREVKHLSGYENLSRLFFTKLDKLGLKPFDAVAGETYDPLRHKEVETIFEENATEITVKSLVLRGYSVFDKVIRPAEVVVSAPPSVVEEEKLEEEKDAPPGEDDQDNTKTEENIAEEKEE